MICLPFAFTITKHHRKRLRRRTHIDVCTLELKQGLFEPGKDEDPKEDEKCRSLIEINGKILVGIIKGGICCIGKMVDD